jgi:DNA-binding SARP family transcriptional activator
MRKLLPKGLIVYDNRKGFYAIEKNIDHWYDVGVFVEWLEQAESADDPEELLQKAVNLYGGEYLPTVYSDWCLELRAVYQAMYVQALSRLALIKSEKGEHRGALLYYQQAIEVEPFQEELHRGLMRAFEGAGRHREALEHYKGLEKLLKEEMDLPPTAETRELSKQIHQRAQEAS